MTRVQRMKEWALVLSLVVPTTIVMGAFIIVALAVDGDPVAMRLTSLATGWP
jgi:hypothetical protein